MSFHTFGTTAVAGGIRLMSITLFCVKTLPHSQEFRELIFIFWSTPPNRRMLWDPFWCGQQPCRTYQHITSLRVRKTINEQMSRATLDGEINTTRYVNLSRHLKWPMPRYAGGPASLLQSISILLVKIFNFSFRVESWQHSFTVRLPLITTF